VSNNNNLYNILSNFAKLTPKAETPKPDAEKIYESVNPRGSVSEGIANIESRLAKQFAESDFSKMSAGIQKSGKSKASADAITAAAGREKLGQREMTRRAVAGKKKANESVVEAQGPGWYVTQETRTGDPDRVAGPFPDQQQANIWIKSNVPPGDYEMYDTMEEGMAEGDESWHGIKDPELLQDMMADARVMDYDEFYDEYSRHLDDPEEFWSEYHVAQSKKRPLKDKIVGISKADYVAKYPDSPGLKFISPDVKESEEECNECGMLESKCECDHSVNEDYKHKGRAYGGAAQKDDEEDDDDEDDKPKSKKLGAPKKKDSERSSASLPFGGKPDTGKHKLPAHKGTTHRHSMSDEPPKGTPERAEWEAKQARRDKAAARKKKKVKEGTSRLESRFRELLGEGRMIDESGSTFDHILNRFKAEVKAFEQGGDLDYDLYEALFDYYCDHGEMPYGTAKARTGDPYEWVTLRLDRDLKDNSMDEAAPKLSGTVPTGLGGLGAVPQTIKPQQTGPLAAVKDTVKGMLGHKDVDHWEMSKPQDEGVEPTMETELNELARLAGLKIADEGNAFTGKLAKTEKGDSFDLDGKKYTDTSNLDEGTCPACNAKPCACNEGNEFSGELAKAKMQHKDSFEVDGKTYPVKEGSVPMKQTFVILDPALIDKIAEMDATEVEPDSDGKGATVSSNNPNVTAQLMAFAQKNPQRLKVTQAMAIDTKRHAGPVDNNWGKPQPTTLEDIAKLSGIAVEGRDYGDTDFEEPAEFANTTEPEVMPANVMLKGGDGEVAGKEKKMSKNGAARFSDNPMESADPLESLGRRLMQAYNSIKIQK